MSHKAEESLKRIVDALERVADALTVDRDGTPRSSTVWDHLDSIDDSMRELRDGLVVHVRGGER